MTNSVLSNTPLADWRGSITTFKGFTGTRPEQELNDVTWPDAGKLLCPDTPAVIADKGRGHYFVPCGLKEAPLVGNTLDAAKSAGQATTGKMRSKNHVTASSMLVMDVDGPSEADFMLGLNKMKRDGVAYLAYTTHSHGRVDKPGIRARIVLPLDRELNGEEYAQAWHGTDIHYWGGQAGQADASGANLCQQQGTWACDPTRVEQARKWEGSGAVASAEALITINQAAQPQQTDTGTSSSARTTNNFQRHKGNEGDYPDSDANKVADKCQQIGAFRDAHGADQSEPLWFDCLGIVGYCIDGEAICQEWSSGYVNYDAAETARKLAHRLKVAPTTCDQFQKSNPAGCQGCVQTCNSPIALGLPDRDCFTPLQTVDNNDSSIADANTVVAKLIEDVKHDSAAALEDDAVSALATIKQAKPSDYQRKRAALKQANRDVSLSAIDSAVKSWEAEISSAPTHHGYAKNLLTNLVHEMWRPVGYQGGLYVLDTGSNLWRAYPVPALVRNVAELHDGQDNCKRSSDYRAIAEHAIALATDESYFANAPIGVACPSGFYHIVGEAINLVPLKPDHRQRVMLEITPTHKPTPEFDAFLHDTFKSKHEGEEEQQLILVQEIAGAIMLGIMPKYQKAVLFFEPFGRAGKGTMERILRSLVPPTFVTAISPFKWSQDYHVATLAGSRLNVVGELPENEAIPASSFKSVIGGDLITGRHPTHRPITFTNEAAHLFMSNHLITTKDQSEAFYSRWLIMDFPNSRLRSGLPLDPGLAERIITDELTGIAYWALEGASRLIRNGKFSKSAAHDRLMAKWRRSTSSLDEFIHECCELWSDCQVRRSDFYVAYSKWCGETGRKPFSKSRVKDLLEHNLGLGVRLSEVNGYEIFRGLKFKPAKKDSNAVSVAPIDDAVSLAPAEPDVSSLSPLSATSGIAF